MTVFESFEAERKYWNELKKKYIIYGGRAQFDECDECDTERVIKCLMTYYNETALQIIRRLEESNIDSPITMNDEIFWIEKDV